MGCVPTAAVELVLTVIAVGCVTVAVMIAEQPFASVAVMAYPPAQRFVKTLFGLATLVPILKV